MPKKDFSFSQLGTSGENLRGKVVLLRVDFNVPIKAGRVVNNYRILQSLPTISYLSKSGAKTIIITHLGDRRQSTKPTALSLNKYIKTKFISAWPSVQQIKKLSNGSVSVLENLRHYSGEEKNTLTFAKSLARLGDIYINDAFSASHRHHASIVTLPSLLPSRAGFLFVKEYINLSKIFSAPAPFLLILGGAKFETKIPLVKKYLKQVDEIYIVGALAHVFYRKMGFEIGRSLVDKDIAGLTTILANKKIHLPVDLIVKTPTRTEVKLPEEIGHRDIIYDAGPNTIRKINQSIKSAKTILWNGPLGNFEMGYDQGTKTIAKSVGQAKAYSVVGGGDTIASIAELKLGSKFGFVSTAGGAMLDFLTTGTLPGIQALSQKK